MDRIRFRFVAAACQTPLWLAIVCLLPSMCRAADVPRGIYALGSATDNVATPQDERLANIRTYDFVSGYTLRLFWSDLETLPDQYNFSVIDSAIQTLAASGRGLNLEIFTNAEPAYVLAGASSTYIDHNGGTNPVPWDPFAQQRHAALFAALANHVVTVAGNSHPMNQDATLRSIDTAPAGLNFGVRDLNSGIRNHPDYTQQKYIDAVVGGVHDAATQFPNDTNSLAFFSFTDSTPGPRVDTQIIQQLAPLYNGPAQPRLDFFVENLSDNFPIPLSNGTGTAVNLMDWVSAGGDTMMQALDSWLQHRIDREDQLASHNPATGINLADNLYSTRFFELYKTDLDGAVNGALDAAGKPLLDGLRYWNSRLTAADLPGDYNFNGVVDAGDYVTWRKSVGTGQSVANDNTAGVDTNDFERWRLNFGLPAVGVPGDYNSDGIVDAGDYIAWRKNLGSAQALPNDNTAGVDANDFDRWRLNFGQSAGTGSQSFATAQSQVPEPSTVFELEMGAAVLLCLSWRMAPASPF
jgi:hypothetical protein